MAPAPGAPYQSAQRWFMHYLTVHVQLTGRGEVFGAPFDVELAPNFVV